MFSRNLDDFSILPDSPFTYWVDPNIARKLAKCPSLEATYGFVRQGIATTNDFRFVRLVWEVPPNGILAPPTVAKSFDASRPQYREDLIATSQRSARWAFHVKAGASQLWHSPLTCLVDWERNGASIKPERVARNQHVAPSEQHYFMPGFSWTRRAVRIIPYIVPAGSIPSASRYQAFPNDNVEVETLGIAACNVSSAFARFYGEKFVWPNFLVENIKSLPFPSVREKFPLNLKASVENSVAERRRLYRSHEPFQEFSFPVLLGDWGATRTDELDQASLLTKQLEESIASALGLTSLEYEKMCLDLWEAVNYRRSYTDPTTVETDGSPESADFTFDTSDRDKLESLISYIHGVCCGRWDIRHALEPELCPDLGSAFDPLPACPPGMLLGPNGLPAITNHIVSEGWLHARANAISIPAPGVCEGPDTITDEEYPLRIVWDGILVDDPGLDEGDEAYDADIVRRVREALAVIWPDSHEAIEAEACRILGVRELRDYFRKPSGFFADHLKRYSKSRRQAPIYWPLSTRSGRYTVWLYYHRLDDQTLYTVVNAYVDPKLHRVEDRVNRLAAALGQASGREATQLRDRLDDARSFLAELRDFREELLRVAALPYKPDLNDGVIINAAPLHKLFGLRKWAKDTEAVWRKLERGEYDWAHLAYTVWPDRVREVCRHDRSIAIAHGLEELCEAPVKAVKARRGQQTAAETEELEFEAEEEPEDA